MTGFSGARKSASQESGQPPPQQHRDSGLMRDVVRNDRAISAAYQLKKIARHAAPVLQACHAYPEAPNPVPG
jgi:hypothetical protein